jgi:hypothetical protein
MTVPRSVVELALDELVSNQEGMRFQGLAVVLAKLRWPEFIACERQRDLGLDAYAPSSLSPGQVGKGLACSITPTLNKIQTDARRAKEHYRDVQVLLFATAGKVSKQLEETWQKEIAKEFGWELHVISREDIVTSLQLPENASLCSAHLGIPLPAPEPGVAALLDAIGAATRDVIDGWSRWTEGKPVIDLRLVPLDDKGAETQGTVQLAGLDKLLRENRRLVIEAPAGRGKTTTLIQLARQHQETGRLAFLVDLPAWVGRKVGIFDFLAGMPEFQLRGISAQALASLYRSQQLTFLLNGWNELAPAESENAASRIRELERSFVKAGIAIATRAHPVTPRLPGSSRFKIRTLTSAEREAYLTVRLGDRAPKLLGQLRASSVLKELTTTPLVLAEVASLFEADKHIPPSKLGVLDAVARLMEESGVHPEALASPPLRGLGWRYLEGLGSWLVASGGVQIPEARARAVVGGIARDLENEGQLSAIPEPDDLLAALTAHDVLERSTYPDVNFTFFHQQFQELFAALRLQRELVALVTTSKGRAEFTAKYLNEPAWSEPLYMLAGFIGQESDEKPAPNAVAMGAALVEMALPVDPVFASELTRLCGMAVWNSVRTPVSTRLRHLYQSSSKFCRSVGFAGMVATGSQDFGDVIVPLLSSEDQSIRLDVYRIWEPFPISILGRDWKQTVERWNEGARADFVSTFLEQDALRDEVMSLAFADPSAKVREIPLSALWHVMPTEEFARFAMTLDDDRFFSLLDDVPIRFIPLAMRPRAAAIYMKRAEQSTDASLRFNAWTKAAELGESRALEGLKKELPSTNAQHLVRLERGEPGSAMDLLRNADAAWVSAWVTELILLGAVHGDVWLRMVTSIPSNLKETLLDRVTSEDLRTKNAPGIVPLLKKVVDEGIVRRLFQRICELQPIIAQSRPGDDKRAEADLAGQLETMLREMPPTLVIASILEEVAGKADAGQMEVIVDLFHIAGREGPPLREALTPELRERFRTYLKSVLEIVLAQDDFSGQLKGYFATVLAQIGDPADLPVLEQLIQADIERVRVGRIARAAEIEAARKGRRHLRSKQGNGAFMSWTVWHTQAVLYLARDNARDLLVRLLSASGYELDAAWALFQLARKEPPSPEQWPRNWPMRNKGFEQIWAARAGESGSIFVESRRSELAAVLRAHIESLLALRSKQQQPQGFTWWLKEFAVVLAELDGEASSDLVLEILCLTETAKTLYDGWTKINALEALLMHGVVLPDEKTWEIIAPIVDHVRAHRWDTQQWNLLTLALCILVFTDRPTMEIARVREILQQDRLSGEGIGRLVRALGQSRADGAVGLLREFADGTIQVPYLGETWVDAIAQFDTKEGHDLLWGFVDPSLPQLPQQVLGRREDRLVLRLAELARRDAKEKHRLFALVHSQLNPTQISLLGKVLLELGSTDSLLHALELLNDDGPSAASYELHRSIEDAFLERRPYQEFANMFTVVPRSSNAIRNKLLAMVQHDSKRRKSAYAMLMQIESWRSQHGRPNGEPRSPGLWEGLSWPPELPTG